MEPEIVTLPAGTTGEMEILDGAQRILVNKDPNRVISFNTDDVVFVAAFYALLRTFHAKMAEFDRREKALWNEKEEDPETELPVNMGARIGLVEEICNYIREEIDRVFGVGTSQAAFLEARVPHMFYQFFDKIEPYLQESRTAKTVKYTMANKRNHGKGKGKK